MRNPRKEEGQGLVEYALLLVLVAIVIIVILALMGRTITTVYAQVYAGLNGQALDGSGTEYIVTAVNVNLSGSDPFCTVTSMTGSVVVFVDGQLADAGVGVSGDSFWGGGSGSVSGTTDSSGTASVSGGGGAGDCSGTAGITVDGNTKTIHYGN